MAAVYPNIECEPFKKIDFGHLLLIVVHMNVALTSHFEGFIHQLISSGRYNNASEVVRAALRELQEKEGEVFPPGSLKHLYTPAHNRAEMKLMRGLRVLEPDEV